MTTTLTFDINSARQLQSFDYEVVGLLDRICAELEITEAMFRLAEERYLSIAAYLDEEGSPLHRYRPLVYPHGSMNTETTVKPIGSAEHDVDVICRLLVNERNPQLAFLNLVYDRLKQRNCYVLERKNRCIRVQYANEFHIDITPGIPDIDMGGDNILVTDKEAGRLKESNTKGYAAWLRTVASLAPRVRYADRGFMRKFAAAEPLPAPRFSKPMLIRVVQLMKRHRDVMFEGDHDAPISAIITTLAGLSYAQHATQDVFQNQVEFLRVVVQDMPNFITQDGVLNPANSRENYADKWVSHPERRVAFFKWHAAAVLHVDQVLASIGKGKLTLFQSLAPAYGESLVKTAMVKHAEARRAESDVKRLGVTQASGLIAPIAAGSPLIRPVLPVLRHTNFGI
jgi:hypothetical protein